MHKLTKAIKQKRFEAICREFNDIINTLSSSNEISVSYQLDHYVDYKKIDIHFYKWDEQGCIVDSIWFYASTNLCSFDHKIKVMRDALIAFKKGEFVWSEQAAIEKQTL